MAGDSRMGGMGGMGKEMRENLQGIFVAIATPFRGDGAIDWAALERYVDWLCEKGVQGIVPCGTTGEFLGLSAAEQGAIIDKVTEVVAHRAVVIAGTSAPTIQETIGLSRRAEHAGADGVLIVAPYYAKPSQEGIKHYFSVVHHETNLPLIVYHNPGRAVAGIEKETLKHLLELPRIKGLKESSTDIARHLALYEVARSRPDFTLFCGEDSAFLSFLASGGKGIISVTAGVDPERYLQLFHAWCANNPEKARDIALELKDLVHHMFAFPSPVPVKTALQAMGFYEAYTRLPLGSLPPERAEELRSCLSSLALLG